MFVVMLLSMWFRVYVFSQMLITFSVMSNNTVVQTRSYPENPLILQERLLKQATQNQPVQIISDSHQHYCRLAMRSFEWLTCGKLDVMLVGKAALKIKNAPPSHWSLERQRRMILDIEYKMKNDDIDLNMAKSKAAIEFNGWLMPPKWDAHKNFVYYATQSRLKNKQVIHIKATTQDEQAYVIFRIEPEHVTQNISNTQITTFVEQAVDISMLIHQSSAINQE
jgi:hypothetical protein